MRISTSRSFSDTEGSFSLPSEERVTNTRSFPSAWPWRHHEMHGCCTGPFEAPGHSCVELPGRLAHSGSLQGASESSQRYCSTPHPFSWPQMNAKKSVLLSFQRTLFLGVHLDSIQMQALPGYPILQHVWPASS